jgi:hypothetical protein
MAVSKKDIGGPIPPQLFVYSVILMVIPDPGYATLGAISISFLADSTQKDIVTIERGPMVIHFIN